jgi:hypothetical protein
MTMHLLEKWFVKKYSCWFGHREFYVPYKTVLEGMIDLTSSSRNIHGFVDNNINTYRSMMMNEIRMNHDYSGEVSCNILLDE